MTTDLYNNGADPGDGRGAGDAAFEASLRDRFARLAAHAPSTVVAPDEIYLRQGPETHEMSQRPRWFRLGVPVAALLVGTGVTAYAAGGGGEPTGGAATPVEAVQALVDSLAAEDVLGALDVLVPEEAAALRHALDDARTTAVSVGVADERLSLSGIEGLDLRWDDLALDSVEFDRGLVAVQATAGRFVGTFDPTVFPRGGALEELIDETSGLATAEGDVGETQLVTVERDGRWYVSAGYSLLDAARVVEGFPMPAAPAPAGDGFDSPEAAATEFYQRLAALDLAGAADTLDPVEGEAARRYLPLWLDAANASIELGRQQGFTMELADLTVAVRGTGQYRVVSAPSFRLTGTFQATGDRLPIDTSVDAPRPFGIERRDGCATLTGAFAEAVWFGMQAETKSPVDPIQVCTDDENTPVVMFYPGNQRPGNLPPVTVVERDGRWYVSPMTTLLGQLTGVFRGVEDPFGIDGPLALAIFGTNRTWIDARLADATWDALPLTCQAIVMSETDLRIIPDPSRDAVRACGETGFFW